MKHATLLWRDRLIEKKIPFKLVNMVHDEWQTECPNDQSIALAIAEEQCTALREVGERLNLRCPLAGSYETDGHITIGDNWKVTH
jgi:DNA polymerase-1